MLRPDDPTARWVAFLKASSAAISPAPHRLNPTAAINTRPAAEHPSHADLLCPVGETGHSSGGTPQMPGHLRLTRTVKTDEITLDAGALSAVTSVVSSVFAVFGSGIQAGARMRLGPP